MIDHLIFDTTSIQTIEDTHNLGAYIRSGKAGALITNRSLQKASAGSFTFVDADVSVGNNTITETAHGFQTGDKLQLTTSGVLPAGLALVTDYYAIRVDANTIKLAISAYNAEWNNPVDITAAAGGGTHTVTGVEVEGRSLDVWISNPSIAISDGGGTITVDGTVELGATTLAALENITVSATDLDIRDLVFATDKVDVTGSTVELGATTLAALETITVVATDLDIRDLTHVSDSIKIGDGTDFLAINADGSINVNADISVVNGHEKAEDAAHVSGDVGSYVLAVRQDTLASSTSTDGDYASLKVNSVGALYVDLASSSGTLTVSDAALANTAIASAAETLDVANTAQNVIASPLANRKYLWIYNNDNTKAYVGQSGVTAANGFPVSPGSYMELRAGAAVDIEFVSAKINHEIRTLEIS
jgi:hypothetical protein